MTATLAGACPSCANAVVAGDAFCEMCGSALGPSDDAVAIGTPAPRMGPCGGCGAPRRRSRDGYCEVCGRRVPEPGDHVEVALTGAAGVSDKGRRRRNQDAFALCAGGDGEVMAAVCDGVSASARPEQAAAAAAGAALGALQAAAPGQGLDDAYVAALQATARVAWDPAEDDSGPPSCTLLALTSLGDEARLLSVGDCRAYWLPEDGEPRTLTEDDSWASEQVAAGAMTADEAYADHRSHVITHWLGADADPAWQPRCVDFRAPGPGRLVLCSDGMWNYASSAAEMGGAAGAGDALSTCHRLVDFAIRGGGHDNVTVVVIDLPRPLSGADGDDLKGRTP